METKNMSNVENVNVSSEDFDVLRRIASDHDVTIEEVTHNMIINGVKHSSFRLYADPASAIAQKKADGYRQA
jgi:hypothetical protein